MDKKETSNNSKDKSRIGSTLLKEMEKTNGVDAILRRLKNACGATSDKQLAAILGIRRQSIGAARRRDKIPPNWIIDIGKQYNASFDWLFYGEASPPKKTSTPAQIDATNNLPLIDTDILEKILISINDAIRRLETKLSTKLQAILITTLYEISMARKGEMVDDATINSIVKTLVADETKKRNC